MGTTRLRRTIVGAALLVVAGCGGSNSEHPDDGAEVTPEPLDCDTVGFPCSWADATEESWERSSELLVEADRGLRAGRDPEAVADELAQHADVVTALASTTGIQIRVVGAPPVVAFVPETVPLISALSSESLPAAGDTSGGAFSPIALAAASPIASLQTLAAQTDTTHAYRPVGEPDTRPRTALVIAPWTDLDIERFAPAGREGETAAMLGRTRAALEQSEHVVVTDAVDDSAFSAWAGYDLVFVQTHTSTWGSETTPRACLREEGHVCGKVLGGWPIVPEGEGAEYQELTYSSSLGLPAGATLGVVQDTWTVGFTPDFFRIAYRGGLESMIILNGCGTADSGSLGGSMLQALSGGPGAGPAVFGWTDFINATSADGSTAQLVRLLFDEGLTAGAALTRLGELGLDAHRISDQTDTPTLVSRGTNHRARDVVEAMDDGETMEPGAVLEVVGTPDDGTDDRIEKLVIRVDGVIDDQRGSANLTWQLRGRHDDPIEIEDPFVDRPDHRVVELEAGDAAGTDVSDSDVAWTSYVITMTNVDLGFDVQRDDLGRDAQGERLRVEVRYGDGPPSRHEIDPVYLRSGTIEVVDPEFGQPLEADEVVELDGTAGDGEPEPYPLVAIIDGIDDETTDSLVLEVSIGETSVSIPASDWERIEEGRYRIVRDVDLPDFDEDEREVAVRATLELPEIGPVEFEADPVVLRVGSGGCSYLSGADMSAAMGRAFPDPVALEGLLAGTCRWEAERSTIDVSLVGGDAVEDLRSNVAAGDPNAVDGFGDAAVYDLTSGNALNPSSIEIDGEVQYTNFVNLFVVIDDATYAWIQVRGNVVVEEGPESGLLGRLRALVDAIREAR